MPTSRRSKRIMASPEQVWEVISDPHHMPRWWPQVKRMEGVDAGHFTQVFTTKRGRPVRMDYRIVASEPPGPGGDPPGHLVWEQDVTATPFERVLHEAITEIAVEPAGESSLVTIALSQKLRGYSRTGGFLLSRATKGRLDEALEGLAQILTAR